MKRLLTLLFLLGVGLPGSLAQQATSTTQGIRYVKLANTLRQVDKAEASIDLLKRALPAFKSTNFYWEAVANELLGLSYSDLHDTTTALRYLEKARGQYLKLKYVASAWGVNEIVRNLSSKNLYAGVQIGSSSIKLAILKTKYETDFYEKDIKSVVDIANPSETFFADASGSLRAGQDALRACFDSIQRYNIPNERVFVVLSNDVREELARNPQNRQRLYSQLGRVLPNSNIKIDTTLTANREAELFTTGAIPRKVWPTTSALDLGSNSTVGGYFDPVAGPMGAKTFHGINLPYGTSSLVAQIESKRSLNMDAYKREAQRVIKTIVDKELPSQFNASNQGLQTRKTVGLGGTIVWALITYLHPEKAGIAAVAITPEDVERFKRVALNDYRELTQPKLDAVTDPAIRSQAEKDITTLQSQLNEKQLIAGALWLDSIMKAYSASTPKRFVFVRNADIGWVTGKFLETINYEYESTIAKGALYTR